jgi:predicted nuclease of predicted toxin-antitoxin system
VRVDEVLPITAQDEHIVARAGAEGRSILTQDLYVSAVIALSGNRFPSLISLRLSSSRIGFVNAVLQKVLPAIEEDVMAGSIVTVEDARVRRRSLPID